MQSVSITSAPQSLANSNWANLTPKQRDEALLGLISDLTHVTEIQTEAIGKLDERIHTLELESVV